jgi:hypothetical protein
MGFIGCADTEEAKQRTTIKPYKTTIIIGRFLTFSTSFLGENGEIR